MRVESVLVDARGFVGRILGKSRQDEHIAANISDYGPLPLDLDDVGLDVGRLAGA